MTLEQFAALLHQRFVMKLDDGRRLDLTLVEAQALPIRAGHNGQAPQRAPFTLLFRGPMTPVCPQRIYALDHETLGEISIFLVPVGPDQLGQRYEAVFN